MKSIMFLLFNEKLNSDVKEISKAFVGVTRTERERKRGREKEALCHYTTQLLLYIHTYTHVIACVPVY